MPLCRRRGLYLIHYRVDLPDGLGVGGVSVRFPRARWRPPLSSAPHGPNISMVSVSMNTESLTPSSSGFLSGYILYEPYHVITDKAHQAPQNLGRPLTFTNLYLFNNFLSSSIGSALAVKLFTILPSRISTLLPLAENTSDGSLRGTNTARSSPRPRWIREKRIAAAVYLRKGG